MELFWFTINVYWLMYALSFMIGLYILKKRNIFTRNQLDNFFMYIFFWVILWGRIWYVLFYNLDYYLQNLQKIIFVWEWGMSFHWWVIWVIIAMLLFSYKNNLKFLRVSDELTSILPIGLFLWRIGNYFNKELLWYSGYNWWFGVEKNWTVYFPSPLLEALLEWIILYIILCYVYKNKKFDWQVASLFLIFYWIFRLIVEFFFRQPDNHLGLIIWSFSMWTLLTIPMILFGLLFYIYFSKNASK